ncbi:MAG TPA: von Willebrand factor type A domain-containing protein [Gemmatimonadales bacterium]|jgi:Ca-activated chloride channel family protein
MRSLFPRLARRVPVLASLFTLVLSATGAAPVVVAPATGRVEGRVLNGDGRPLVDAQVLAVGSAFNVLTDSTGRYAFTSLPAGARTLRATLVGYAPVEAQVTVLAGRTVTHDFTLTSTLVAEKEEARLQRTFVGRQSLQMDAVAAAGLAAKSAPATSPAPWPGAEPWRRRSEPWNTEAYARIEENRFLAAMTNPLSTFSIDVDAASYSNVRRFLSSGSLPPADAVRLEELVNYFTYRYPEPDGSDPFAVATEMGACPWAADHRLVRIGLQGKRIPTAKLPPSNLVFLIDVSGSMMSEDKLPLVKQAFRALVGELRPQDRVAIVVYAGAAGLVLPPTAGDDKRTILDALDRLEAGGSTAGGAGLRLAYDVAREHFLSEGNNRVILATDGDFNVGVSSDAEMIRLVEARRSEGTFLTVLGFGTGNLKDTKMEQMADKGNGHYAYIDTFREAQKVFVQEFGGTLFTIAKDVKIQVEFNPAKVQAYRLLGYENRLLAKEDFADDRKDAGELGAGHTVTALYEIVPVGARAVALVDDSLVYQHVSLSPRAARSSDIMTVRLRYKEPKGITSKLLTFRLGDREVEAGSEDMRFASAVASFAMLLRDSDHKGTMTFDQVIDLARSARGADVEGYRGEFIGMVQAAKTLRAAEPADDGRSGRNGDDATPPIKSHLR